MGIAALAIIALLLVVFVVLPLVGFALWMILSIAVVGLLIGGLARLVIPGRQPIGVLATIAIGITGSLVGSLIGHAIGTGQLVSFLLELGVAVVGVLAVNRRHLTVIGRPGRYPVAR